MHPVIIQARMGSKRFPGKVLAEIQGRPLIQQMLFRLKDFSPIVAIPDNSENDVLGEYLEGRCRVYRGSEDDVAGRLLGAAGDNDYFVRICGDSPFIDPAVVEAVMQWPDMDLVAYLGQGNCAELIRTETLKALHEQGETDEHVTTGFYRNARRYNILVRQIDGGIVIDTPEDLKRCG